MVRARIDAELKAEAAEVLRANGLDVSDAIRLFLRQVVRRGGLPFPVRDPAVGRASSKRLWGMKRKSQARDRDLLARGAVKQEALMLLRPERLQGARIIWPDAPLIDD